MSVPTKLKTEVRDRPLGLEGKKWLGGRAGKARNRIELWLNECRGLKFVAVACRGYEGPHISWFEDPGSKNAL